MTAAERRLAAAAACLAGARATALLALGPAPEARAEAARLAALPREERLRALVAEIQGASPANGGARTVELGRRERARLAGLVSTLARGGALGPEVAPPLVRIARERLLRSEAAPRTSGRRAGRAPRSEPLKPPQGRPSSPGTPRGLLRGMALPLDLPLLSRGFVALRPPARAAGGAVAEAAARSLSAIVGAEVAIRGRAVPGRPLPRAGASRLTIELTALPGVAVLELDPALVVRTVDLMAGGAGEAAGASALTPFEETVAEVLALAAVEGAVGLEEIEALLGPRLARTGAEPGSALAIELTVSLGAVRGWGRLLVPHAAVEALRGPVAIDASPLRLPASLRRGRAALSTEELDALAPGDVVVVDPPGDGRDALVLPGGLVALGRLEDDAFHVEETIMSGRHAQLPVMLEVELARVEVPLAELARLEPGAVLPIAIDRRGLVTLRAGERALARGELVDVEGAIGVRIVSLEDAP